MIHVHPSTESFWFHTIYSPVFVRAVVGLETKSLWASKQGCSGRRVGKHLQFLLPLPMSRHYICDKVFRSLVAVTPCRRCYSTFNGFIIPVYDRTYKRCENKWISKIIEFTRPFENAKVCHTCLLSTTCNSINTLFCFEHSNCLMDIPVIE